MSEQEQAQQPQQPAAAAPPAAEGQPQPTLDTQPPIEAAPRPAPKLERGAYCWVGVNGKYEKGQIAKVVGGNVMILVNGEYVSKLRARVKLCHKDDETPPEE